MIGKKVGRREPSLGASVCLLGLTVGAVAFAVPNPKVESQPSHEPSLVQKLAVERANRWAAEREDGRDDLRATVARPYAEYERGRYLLIAATPGFNSLGITTRIAQNLPSGVKLIVLAASASEQQSAYQTYRNYLDDRSLSVVNLGTKPGLWARDSLPVPVFTDRNDLALVDARYYHGNEPDQAVANAFRVPLVRHNFYFEGGNLLNDDQGNCFIINKSGASSVSDDSFERYYGCKTVERLPHVAGIGHVDERIKVLPGKKILTDETSYFARLRNLGYDVTMLPRPRTSFGTYANALYINGTVFMPTYGESGDREAEQVYKNLGYRVVGVPSSELSSQGKGSVHCITMVYPDVSEAALLKALGL